MGMNTLFTLGGPVMYFLILLSIYALAVILYKIHVFRKVNFFESKNIGSSIGLWKSGNKDEAYDLIKKADHPVEEVVSFGMYQLLKNTKPTAKMEDELKEEMPYTKPLFSLISWNRREDMPPPNKDDYINKE